MILGRIDASATWCAQKMALALLSSPLSFQAAAAPKIISRSAVSMQASTWAPTKVAGGVVPTQGRYQSYESAILVQGGSLRTWSYRSPMIEQVQVVLSTEGRPLDADVEL